MEAEGLMQKLWCEILWSNTVQEDCNTPLVALTNLMEGVTSIKKNI